MDTIYSLLILFVLYCIVSDWFMHEYGEKLNGNNFYKFKIGSFFSYQIPTLKRLVSLDEKSLARQPIFWILIGIPLIGAVWIEYQIYLLNPKLFLLNETNAITKLFTESASALYVSALIPTFGVLISNIHKSIQVSVELKTSDNDNKVNLFFKHRDWFVNEINKINSKNSLVTVKNPLLLYGKIYKNSNYNNGLNSEVSSKLLGKVVHELMEAEFELNNFNKIIGEDYFGISSSQVRIIDKCAHDLEHAINFLEFEMVKSKTLQKSSEFLYSIQNNSDYDPYIFGKNVIYIKYDLIEDVFTTYLEIFKESIKIIDGVVKIIEFDSIPKDIHKEIKRYIFSFKGSIYLFEENLSIYKEINPLDYYGNDFKDEQ
ncbi:MULTISPECIES: hypothetical protein [Providencia]|uniref:Uncharacterized protein n=1 Tax=Providencia rettgeri TaxID=587 RepID=A0A379FVM2_PRORE|nr:MULTISPECIES: hypothetical protein [Providencia]QXB05309.1 hypothetical protein I6L80_18525 [Providencia rettgeri]SUC32728.1 Uncharacterised protein [Providencia rettgeri]